MPKAELFARIDAVDAATVKAVANRFVLDQDIALASLGDTQVRRRRGARAAAGRADLPTCWAAGRDGFAEERGHADACLPAGPPTCLSSRVCQACHAPPFPALQFLPDYTWMRRRTYWLRY
jgi:hypothetical protein